MLPTLSGFAAIIAAAAKSWQLAMNGHMVAAAVALVIGFCTFALLRTLSDIADALADIRNANQK